jgi:hypothetical protein
MDTTLWQMVASGAATTLISNLNSIANRDTRARLIEQGAFEGQLTVQLAASLGYTPYRSSVQTLMRNIKNPDIDPTFEPDIPIPQVTLNPDNSLSIVPVEGYVPHYFLWDYKTFEDLGVVPDTALPAGVYVVAFRNERNREAGLPTGFITVAELDKRARSLVFDGTKDFSVLSSTELHSMTGWIKVGLPLGGGLLGTCEDGGAPVFTQHPNGAWELYCAGKENGTDEK